MFGHITALCMKELNAKFVAMKDETYELKLEIKSLKECIEKVNSKSSVDREYNQNNKILFQSKKFHRNKILLTNFLIFSQIQFS